MSLQIARLFLHVLLQAAQRQSLCVITVDVSTGLGSVTATMTVVMGQMR